MMESGFLKARPLWLLFLLLAGINTLRAQCTGCTTTYASNSGTNITINTGQTVCVNSGVTMSGTISLNGGVLCNSGTVNNLRLTNGKGTIKNYGTIRDAESSISFVGNASIYCYASSQFSFASVTFSLGTIDSLYFNLASGANVYFASDLTIGSRKLSINNAGTFRVSSNLNVNNAELTLSNASGGTVTVSGSVNLTTGGKKTINNMGKLTAGNAFNIGGSASGATTRIDNIGILTVTNNMECTMTSGNFNLNNTDALANLSLGQDLILNQNTNTVQNTGTITVNRHINTNSGSITNDGVLNCTSNFTVSGIFTNDKKVNVQGNLIVQSGAKVNAYGLIEVGTDFKNYGKFKMGQQALLRTKNYYNIGSDTLFGAPTTVTDTVQYARISVTNYSENSGKIRSNVMVYDESLVYSASNIDYGFDVITSPGNIQNTVIFVSRTISPGTGGVVIGVRNRYYQVAASASAYNILCGTSINLSSALYIPYSIYSPLGPVYSAANYALDVPSSSFVWQPGSLVGPSQTVIPTTTTTYIINISYLGQTYTSQFIVNVTPITVTTGAAIIDFAMPDAVSLSATPVTGTAPFSYAWSPNAFFTYPNNYTQQNPQANPKVSLTYQVTLTDSKGCVATATTMVIAHPYAPLNKIPDGSYYKLFNNKMLFKYDGQYATTGLTYKVLNSSNTVVASNTSGNIATSLVVNSGDNRYYLNASSLAAGYYTFEITNEKNEKLYLRFVK